MVEILIDQKKLINFSIVPGSLCNLSCVNCPVDSDGEEFEQLDCKLTSNFLKTIDFDLINSVEFSGGEPSINLGSYIQFIEQLPPKIFKLIVTNGTWSKNKFDTESFIEFCANYNLMAYIKPIKQFQDEKRIKEVCTIPFINLKKDDPTSKTGRGYRKDWICTKMCQRDEINFIIMPNGDITLKICDGFPPIIQTIKESFSDLMKNYKDTIKKCMEKVESGKPIDDILPKRNKIKIQKKEKVEIKWAENYKPIVTTNTYYTTTNTTGNWITYGGSGQ